jgi:hypothetical protein
MSRYRKIDVGIHNDIKFRTLSDKAKLLWFTLLTFPDLTAIGCMRFTEAGMAENMDWPLKDFQKAFKEVFDKGMVQFDPQAKFLCFPNFIKYNAPESPNVVRGWARLNGLLPECKLKDEYIQSIKDFVKDIGKGFGEAFPEGWLKTKPYQEQEQEQEQEQDKKIIAPPGVPPVPALMFFSCQFFDVDLNYRFKLAKEYPALHDDLLRKELSKMEDWISDNAQKKKFKANGRLANPKLFIKNWLDRVGGILGPGSSKPKGFGAVQRFIERGEEDE